MSRKRYTPEQIIGMLREAKIGLSQGQDGWRDLPWLRSVRAELRDECLNMEIFTRLKEAKVLIEKWRCFYNTERLHSSLGYRPATSQAILPPLTRLACAIGAGQPVTGP